jgi:hypothetical protein
MQDLKPINNYLCMEDPSEFLKDIIKDLKEEQPK